jgi:hypothetical protein
LFCYVFLSIHQFILLYSKLFYNLQYTRKRRLQNWKHHYCRSYWSKHWIIWLFPSLKVKWSIPKFTTLILHFDSVGSTQYTNIVGKYKNYLYELQKLPLANHESYFLCSSNIVTTLTDLRESWDWNMSVNLNIIVHNMYMYISVCPSIAHCNHRRCDSPSDNHCEYCYYEEVDKRYFRGYTRHYDGQMKQCRSKKPVHAVTSIKQPLVLKYHIFLSCHRKFHMNWTSFNRSPV